MMKAKLYYIIILSLLLTSSVFAETFSTKMETIFSSPNPSTRLQHVKSAVDIKGYLHIVFSGFDNLSYYSTNQSGNWQV